MRYLVTTYADRLPVDEPLVMVDGTVPEWIPQSGDRHYDHHRPGGADIQIDEIPKLKEALAPDTCFVTTIVDADACCAAAWVQLSSMDLAEETVAKLRAIAWDCDHLAVPEPLQQYAEFAAKAAAALRRDEQIVATEMALPTRRREWTLEQRESCASEVFRRGTEWLIAAAKGDRPYPGTQGEADHYWDAIAADARWLLDTRRVYLANVNDEQVGLCDLQGVDGTIDPRSFYQALMQLTLPDTLRPETLTVFDHRLGGRQYTLGSIPLHPKQKKIDYTRKIFQQLTEAECSYQRDAKPWGGRRTVGGSAWNQPSSLSLTEIIAIVANLN